MIGMAAPAMSAVVPYVQTLVSQAIATSSTSHAFTVSGTTTKAGSTVVMSLHTGGGLIASSASDSRGNTYHVVGTPVASGNTVTVLYAHLTTPLQNGDTITVVQTGANGARLTALEVAGLVTSPVINSTYKHSATTVFSITTTSVSPGANTNVYWFSAWGVNKTSTGTPSAGYTKRTALNTGGTSSATADFTASTNTSRTIAWGFTPSAAGTVALVAFLL